MSDYSRTAACVIRRLNGNLVYYEGVRIVPAQEMAKLESELTAMTKERDELRSHLRAANKGAERNMQALNISTEKLIAMTKERDALQEALRKCITWAVAMSAHYSGNREEINWTYLNEARECLTKTTDD